MCLFGGWRRRASRARVADRRHIAVVCAAPRRAGQPDCGRVIVRLSASAATMTTTTTTDRLSLLVRQYHTSVDNVHLPYSHTHTHTHTNDDGTAGRTVRHVSVSARRASHVSSSSSSYSILARFTVPTRTHAHPIRIAMVRAICGICVCVCVCYICYQHRTGGRAGGRTWPASAI